MKTWAVCVVLAIASLGLSTPRQQVLSSSTEDIQEGFNLTHWAFSDASFVPDDHTSTFPFDPKSNQYMDVVQFVRNMYDGNEAWIDHTTARLQFPWMIERLGRRNLVPDAQANPPEPVGTTTNPGWRWADVWRPLNLYNVLITIAAKDKFAVAKFLNSLPDSPLATALFPQPVRDLLIENERAIINNPKGQQWVGIPQKNRPSEYKPFPGVKVTHASDNMGGKFAQTGAVGPMSLEASFILATQLAGINWQTLALRLDNTAKKRGVYWAGAILPDTRSDQTIVESRKAYPDERRLGYLSRNARGVGNVLPVQGSTDAGFYLVLDIDPQVTDSTDTSKNVFVFSTHLIDPHSRVHIRDVNRLRDMTYHDAYLPGAVVPPPIPNGGANVRFYSHGHSAVLQYTRWMDWIGQEAPTLPRRGERLPDYEQIGEMHLYFLPEDENDVWPRRGWLARNPGPNDLTSA